MLHCLAAGAFQQAALASFPPIFLGLQRALQLGLADQVLVDQYLAEGLAAAMLALQRLLKLLTADKAF